MHVAVQVLSFEEERLQDTLDAYAEQPVPSFVDSIEYHACVTPRPELRAGMVEQARGHPVFEYVETPKGKLSSRNYAHDLAVERGADVLLVGDGDSPPISEGYVEAMLRPFRDPEVIAANGNQRSTSGLGPIFDLGARIEDLVRPHMCGRAMAMRAEGWDAAGGFDDTINQTDIYTVRAEEEFGFYWKLNELGHIPFVTEAVVESDSRRYRCFIQRARPGGPRDDFCKRVGTTTFDIRDRR